MKNPINIFPFGFAFPGSSSVPEDYIGRRNLEHVEALQENPVNPNQVVIGYGRGLMVIWDLEKQCALQHIPATQVSRSKTAQKPDLVEGIGTTKYLDT